MSKITTLRADHEAHRLSKPFLMGAIYGRLQDLQDFAMALRGSIIDSLTVRADGLQIELIGSGLKFYVQPDEVNSLLTHVLAFNDVEPTERAVLLACARQAGTIIDIGANIGWYTVHFAAQSPQACIHAFEPSTTIRQRLQANLTLNGITHVTVSKLALSDGVAKRDLYFHPSESGATGFNDNRQHPGTQVESVSTQTLDAYCFEHALKPDLIKCDVEGAELLVIQGAQGILAMHKPVVFLELLRKWSANFNYHPNEVIARLKDLGYGCWAIGNTRLTICDAITEQTLETNFLFIHTDQMVATMGSLPGHLLPAWQEN